LELFQQCGECRFADLNLSLVSFNSSDVSLLGNFLLHQLSLHNRDLLLEDSLSDDGCFLHCSLQSSDLLLVDFFGNDLSNQFFLDDSSLLNEYFSGNLDLLRQSFNLFVIGFN